MEHNFKTPGTDFMKLSHDVIPTYFQLSVNLQSHGLCMACTADGIKGY